MEIRWLTYSGSPRRHAFPVDEKTYGDWSLCGRGSGANKAEGEQPLCGKCRGILEDFSKRELESKRIAEAGEADLYEGHNL